MEAAGQAPAGLHAESWPGASVAPPPV